MLIYNSLSCSDEVSLGIEVVTTISEVSMMFLHVNFESEECSDTTESLNELETLLGFVSDELNLGTIVLIVVTEPFS